MCPHTHTHTHTPTSSPAAYPWNHPVPKLPTTTHTYTTHQILSTPETKTKTCNRLEKHSPASEESGLNKSSALCSVWRIPPSCFIYVQCLIYAGRSQLARPAREHEREKKPADTAPATALAWQVNSLLPRNTAASKAKTDRQLRFELKITVRRFGPHRARFSVQQHPK